MAYAQVWDNSAPDGSVVLAADLDIVIQDLKKAITERMNDLVGATNWENDLVDPKEIQPASISGAGSPAVGFFELGADVNPISVAGTQIIGWVVKYDPGGFGVTGNEFTVPTDGDYEVILQANFIEGTVNPIELTTSFGKNGGAFVGAETVFLQANAGIAPATNRQVSNVHTWIQPLLAGDTIEVIVFNFGAATLTMDANSSHLTIKRLGIV